MTERRAPYTAESDTTDRERLLDCAVAISAIALELQTETDKMLRAAELLMIAAGLKEEAE